MVIDFARAKSVNRVKLLKKMQRSRTVNKALDNQFIDTKWNETQPPTQIWAGSNRLFSCFALLRHWLESNMVNTVIIIGFIGNRLVKTCEILLAYAPPMKKHTFRMRFNARLSFVACIELLESNFLAKLKQMKQKSWLVPANFKLNYGRITFQKLVHAILPTDSHFNVKPNETRAHTRMRNEMAYNGKYNALLFSIEVKRTTHELPEFLFVMNLLQRQANCL